MRTLLVLSLFILLLSVVLILAQDVSAPTRNRESTQSLSPSAHSSNTNSPLDRTGLEGVVTDPSGAVVREATITLQTAGGFSKTALTDNDGKFRIIGLPPGNYEISATAPGFAEYKTAGFVVNAGEIGSLDVQLQPAAAKTEMNVEGQGAAHVETESSEVSGTITQNQIVSLGLNGRNFASLITLAPGVSNQTGQDEAKVGVVGSAKFSVNGGRTEYNTFDVEGNDVLNTDIAASHGHTTLLVYPSLDGIEDMKVLTSNYGALYGRSASGTVLVTTKSGASQFHGNAYEFLRNEAFNSRNYFDKPGKAPLYRRNDFGGTFGGPLFIPGMFNTKKDKTFFFFSEEFRKERSPIEFNQAVPSDAERGYNLVTQSYGTFGDFSDVCPPIPPGGSFVTFSVTAYPDCPGRGTSTRQTFNNNLVVIDPTAQFLMQTGLIPRANATTGCNSSIGSCYVNTVSPNTYWREELLKLDQNLGSKTKLSLSGVHDHWETTTAVPQWQNQPNSFPTVLNSFLGPGVSASAHVTTVISPTFLNDVFVGGTFQRIKLADLPGQGVSLDRSGMNSLAYPMGYLFNNGFGGKLPGIVIGGNNAEYGGFGFVADSSYEPWYHARGALSFRDNLSKVVGKHTMQVGVQYMDVRRHETSAANGANTGNVQGVLTFNNAGSYLTTGNAFADFLLNNGLTSYSPLAGGGIRSFQQDNMQTTYKVRYQVVEPYVQDDWRINQRLVLNLGLRLSLFGNWQPDNPFPLYNWVPSAYNPALPGQSNIAVNPLRGYLQDSTTGLASSGNPIPLDLGNLNPVVTNGLVQCGTNGIPASCQTSHVFNPSPRVGFAWDPWGDGKTSVRAGYGIFFEHGTGSEANAGSLMANPPQVLSMQEDYPANYSAIGSYNSSGNITFVAYPLNMVSIPGKAVWPYVQQWSLGIQREISRNTTATLSYVGTKGTHLAAAMQINQLPPVSAANNPFGPNEPITTQFCQQNQVTATNPFDPVGYFTLSNGSLLYYKDNPSAVLGLMAACDGTPATNRPAISFSLNTLRPYAGVGSILAIRNVASSIYHSMQFTLRRHEGPLDLGIAYTYGHSIDNSSDRFQSNFVDSYNLAANRASSDFDQRHLLNISYVYQMPLLRIAQRLWGAMHCSQADVDDGSSDCRTSDVPTYGGPAKLTQLVLKNWSISGITTFQSGTPFSVVNGASSTGVSVLDNAGLALGLAADSYPDIVPGGFCNTTGSNKGTFGPLLGNPCRFVAPRGLTQGDAGRNSMNNPSRTNFDVALLRDFKFGWKESTLQFRAEAFNVFNHSQFIIFDPNKGNTGSNTISCYGNSSTNYSAAAPACLAGNAFLHPVEAHRPRTIQFGLKFQF